MRAPIFDDPLPVALATGPAEYPLLYCLECGPVEAVEPVYNPMEAYGPDGRRLTCETCRRPLLDVWASAARRRHEMEAYDDD